MRFHLEVEPRAISLSRLRWDGRPPDDVPSVRLPPVHEPTWRAVGPPTQAMLFVEDRDGDVAYLVCLDIR